MLADLSPVPLITADLPLLEQIRSVKRPARHGEE